MDKSQVAAFQAYLDALESAGNEEQKRQAFVAFATRVFNDTQLVTDLTLGAEYKVKFQRAGLLRRGAVDALFGNLVIEFEYDYSKTGNHALKQLRNYVAGAWTEDDANTRPYLAIASDGSEWRVFSTSPVAPDAPHSAENVNLELLDQFSFKTIEDAQSFRNFLNRYFYRNFVLKPSAANIARDFGPKSPALKATLAVLRRKAAELKADVQFQTLRDQWVESLRIAYGSDKSNAELFLLHTYLANLARILVWASLERCSPNASDVRGLLSGDYFLSRGLLNLWEDDFFKWTAIDSETDVDGAWLALARQFAAFDMTGITEDILKPLYEELIDPGIRHGLGEYYTPDWLANSVTDRVLSDWPWSKGVPRVLDPTCGSGTFLRAVIDHMRSARPSTSLQEILDNVIGFDVHPLAIIVSRATYAIAIRDLIEQARDVVALPVYIADSFKLPELTRQEDLFDEDTLPIQVGPRVFQLPAEFVLQADIFDHSIAAVVDVSRVYGKTPEAPLEDVEASIRAKVTPLLPPTDSGARVLDCLVDLGSHLTGLVRDRKDSFFGFVVRNGQRPSILRGSFDYIVGNPPWLTLGDVATSEYKQRLTSFCSETGLASRDTGEQAHTELGTLFLGHVTRTFLDGDSQASEGVRVGFVMPRSVFSGSHHSPLREGGYAKNLTMHIEEIWDLAQVKPLFRVPSCVLFASKTPPKPTLAKDGLVWVGSLPLKDPSPKEALELLEQQKASFELAYLAQRSAWRRTLPGRPLQPAQQRPSASPNAYKDKFRQGAILYPQTLLVVRPDGVRAKRNVPVRVRRDHDATASAKKLTEVEIDQLVDSKNLFLTAAGEHILPYVLRQPLWTVVLPTVDDPRSPDFRPVDAATLRRNGRLETAAWLEWAESHWASARKSTDDTPLHDRLDTYGHLSGQAGRNRFVVLYNASGGRPVSCAFDTEALPLPYVARDKTYWASCGAIEEALFLTAFLNSEYLATSIEGWMTTGLFGPRDIHKRALDIAWPEYNPRATAHQDLVSVARRLAEAAKGIVASSSYSSTGHLRNHVREGLPQDDREAVEKLVIQIAGSV